MSVDANKELMTAWPAFKSSNYWSFKTDTTGSLPSPQNNYATLQADA